MSTRVLIVDDDATALRQLAHHIAAEGYEVVSACGAEEAIGLIHDRDPAIVVADWSMPGMNGLDLCRHVRSHTRRGLYVIVLAAAADRDRLGEALDAGADDCLAKPFDATDLLARLRIGARVVTLERALVSAKGTVDDLIVAVDDVAQDAPAPSESPGAQGGSVRPLENGHRRE